MSSRNGVIQRVYHTLHIHRPLSCEPDVIRQEK